MHRFHILQIFKTIINFEINGYFHFFIFFRGGGGGVAMEVILEDFIGEIVLTE